MFKDLYMITYRRQAALQAEFIRYSEIYRMIKSLRVDPEVDSESIAWFELTDELQLLIGKSINHADENVSCDNFKEYMGLYLDGQRCNNDEVNQMFASRIYGFISPAGKVYLSSVSLEDVALTILSNQEVPLKPLYKYVQELINSGYGVISSDETYINDGSGVSMRYHPVYYLSGFQPTTAQKRTAEYYSIKFVGSGYVQDCPQEVLNETS